MEEEKSFSELFEESITVPTKGTVFVGKVVRIENQDVFIDFGYKSEGVVPISDFMKEEGAEPEVAVGEEVEIILESIDDDDSPPLLSKSKADFVKESVRLETAYKERTIVEARVTSVIKGGLLADVGEKTELLAFIPSSQIDLRPVKDPKALIGETLEVMVIKFTPSSIVLSRRVHLEEERDKMREETLATLEEGQMRSGEVVKLIDQGAFVDLGGIEGFVPISELSWGRIPHPSAVIAEGEKIEVEVIRLQPSEGRITLSYKNTLPNPWESVKGRYPAGGVVSGKVVSIKEFGAFVELEPGIDGLVHTSEITWTESFNHPKEIVSIGTQVDVVVLGVDTDRKRISLSLKQILPSPWDHFAEENPVGTKLPGVVRNVTDKGVFVEVAEGVVGLMRPGDIEWQGFVVPTERYNLGEEIEVVVLNNDPKNQRVSLGVKQLTGDPWKELADGLKPGTSFVKGKVLEVKGNGIVIEMEGGVEGFIRAGELTTERGKDPGSLYKAGDEVTALVTGVDRSRRNINLSVARLEKRQEKDRLEGFLSSQNEETLKLGDVFGEALKDVMIKD